MQILIVGGGGREHAITQKIAQSPLVDKIWIAPGNAGTKAEPKSVNIDIAATNIAGLVHFAKQQQIDFTIVGPEAPLSLGIVDAFTAENLKCFGPTRKASELESSKIFSKELMKKHNIPTAQSEIANTPEEAIAAITQFTFPLVIKADGLAAGKGVFICKTTTEAKEAINELINKKHFGLSGQRLLFEAFIHGVELSYIVLAHNNQIISLASSQDHKRLSNNDEGPNTGGMGAISPSPYHTDKLEEKILSSVIRPTLQAMKQEGRPFQGFLYAGLMITPNNSLYVLEFNVRLGDPETQVILPRLKSDLLQSIINLQQGLPTKKLLWNPQPAVGVVMASAGYPGDYQKGLTIEGLQQSLAPNTFIFHAGTKQTTTKNIVTNGGRVLCVTALAKTKEQAKTTAYELIKTIRWPNCYYRSDIGKSLEKTEA